jgi:hypothetical protein
MPVRSFNRVRDDFGEGDAGTAAYNAYLEQVEGYVAMLASGKAERKAAVEAEIRRYEEAHQAEIARNNQRLATRTAAEEQRLKRAEAERMATAARTAVAEADKRRKAEAAKAALLAELRDDGLSDAAREEVRRKIGSLLDAAQRRASSGSGGGADIPIATTLFVPAPTVALPTVLPTAAAHATPATTGARAGDIGGEWGAAGLVGEVQARWLTDGVDETLFILPR